MAKRELTDLEAIDEPEVATAVLLPGFLWVSDRGGWAAARPGTGFRKVSGNSISGLEPGIWLTNLPFARCSALSEGVPFAILKADGWFRRSSASILSSLTETQASPEEAAGIMAGLATRLYRLLQQVILQRGFPAAAMPGLMRSIHQAPSFATGLQRIHHDDLAVSRPREKRILEILSQSVQSGLFWPGGSSRQPGMIHLVFHFPKLSHGLAVSGDRVPDLARWKIARRDPAEDAGGYLEWVRGLGRPAIHSVAQGAIPETVMPFLIGSFRDPSPRSMVTDEELRFLSGRAELAPVSTVVGEGWRDSATGALLGAVVVACGGPEVAHTSTSVDLLAENILASAFRKISGDRGGPMVEPVWLGARDRILTFPATEDMIRLGARVLSGNLGVIQAICPDDPEILETILATAWRHGLHVAADSRERLRRIGVRIPVSREDFGGSRADFLLSAANQANRTKAILALDAILDLPPEERRPRLRQILD